MRFALCALLLAGVAAGGEVRLVPVGTANYGSGSIVQSSYFPGGLAGRGMGCIAGHANLLTRKDRILFRFDLTDLYLASRPVEIVSATLECALWYVGGAAEGRRVRADHLGYETAVLGANDLSRPGDARVLDAPLALKAHPPKGDDGVYRADVTRQVKEDLAAFRPFATFRLSDSAEERGNDTGAAVCFILQTPNVGHGRVPTLMIRYRFAR